MRQRGLDQLFSAHLCVAFYLLSAHISAVLCFSSTSQLRLSRRNCSNFIEHSGTLVTDGDAPRLVANGFNLTEPQCKDACLRQHSSRYCVVANRNPSTGACVLAGYKLHRNYRKIHFRRICSSGRPCFQQIDGWETHFHTGFIKVPQHVHDLKELSRTADFCRRECENLFFCVGFDLDLDLHTCPFVEFRQIDNTVFDMQRRFCI